MNLDLDGRPFVVAGSSRGIGLGVAEALLAEGARVVLTGRERGPLEAAAARLAGAHGDDAVAAHAGDLGDPDHAEAVVLEATRRWGALAGAVLNVGSGAGAGDWRLGQPEWERVFRANLWTSVTLAEAALPRLVGARAGSLVFVASIAGREEIGAPLAYSTAKAALGAYVKGLARRVGPAGVRVNAVAPGNVLAAEGSWERKLAEDPERWERYVRAEVPLGRFGHPEDIASPIAFLLSPRASFVTGACLVADGGQTRSLAW